ncbi:hypothetical protein E4U54_008805 [Claviceps lovelessii]|nr:hypothetical protein E4U54_008805 [Claviceps lovelessii]
MAPPSRTPLPGPRIPGPRIPAHPQSGPAPVLPAFCTLSCLVGRANSCSRNSHSHSPNQKHTLLFIYFTMKITAVILAITGLALAVEQNNPVAREAEVPYKDNRNLVYADNVPMAM